MKSSNQIGQMQGSKSLIAHCGNLLPRLSGIGIPPQCGLVSKECMFIVNDGGNNVFLVENMVKNESYD